MSSHVLPELWSFNPDSKEEVVRYRAHLETLRIKARDRPLRVSDQLVSQGPPVGDTTILPTDGQDRRRQPIPWLLQGTLDKYRLVPRECLRGGENVLSQVWQCDILGAGNAPAPTVIVKLFQESLGVLPSWDDYQEVVLDNYLPMRVLREQECLAYEAMKPLQGDVVPYSYGFYLVRNSICDYGAF
jgi:hypothetical protein